MILDSIVQQSRRRALVRLQPPVTVVFDNNWDQLEVEQAVESMASQRGRMVVGLWTCGPTRVQKRVVAYPSEKPAWS